MEIHTLSLHLTEQDLNDLLQKHLPPEQPVEELRLRLTPEGVLLTGEYPLFVRVKFETLWDLGVREGKITARLARIKALGLPVSGLKNLLINLISDAARGEDWLLFEEDMVLVLVERLLTPLGIPVRLNLTAVRCQEDRLIVEGGGNGLG